MNSTGPVARTASRHAGADLLIAVTRRFLLAVCFVASFALAPAQTTVEMSELLDHEVIVAVFEDLLGREPTRRELREWRSRSEGMMIQDLEENIRRTREFRMLSPEQIVRNAYRELLDREPDPDGMRLYRRRVIERGWTAGDVREAIRASEEYRILQADVVIDRSFDDLLERSPTADERKDHRRRLLKGGTEDNIRRQLKKSEEYRYTLPRSKITRAYQEILGREPDPEGLENYRKRMINEGWSEDRVRATLLKSPEYRNKNRPKKT
jgi:hypothetical protein